MNNYFYKYRAIYNEKKLDEEQSIKSLFACEAAFSNRNNFNDLFDSKINLVPAKPAEVKLLKSKLNNKERFELASLIKNGAFTPKGDQIINDLINMFNRMIDNYYFYCVSSKNNSNLMWSHYANSHKGFCIEFKADHLNANEVGYEKYLPKIKVIDLIFQKFQMENDELGNTIWKALRTKLEEWRYESEYRFQASNSMLSNTVKSGDDYKIFQYPERFVESIIFGCRAKASVKDYIMENVPFECKFKQAQAHKESSSIIIKSIE